MRKASFQRTVLRTVSPAKDPDAIARAQGRLEVYEQLLRDNAHTIVDASDWLQVRD